MDLYNHLINLQENQTLPRIKAYNRIDGPGSSLDLREFQQAFWTLPTKPVPLDDDAYSIWSKGLPRTVGITISTGSVVEAHPLRPGFIGLQSREFPHLNREYQAGHVPYTKEAWLLKILDVFHLSGLEFRVRSLVDEEESKTKSAGLGGSATVTTAVCLLANELADRPFKKEQIVGMASLMEQDMGVSITGTQEQSNVAYGGVTDYVWCPFGIPHNHGHGGYGSSIRKQILPETEYHLLQYRFRIYHSGVEHASVDVNSVWCQRLTDQAGYDLHHKQITTAFEFREGLRQHDWDRVLQSMKDYVAVRTELCSGYMSRECWSIQKHAEKFGAQSFPLGAGGGGAVLIFCPDPEKLNEFDSSIVADLKSKMPPDFKRLPFKIRANGHEFENMPD